MNIFLKFIFYCSIMIITKSSLAVCTMEPVTLSLASVQPNTILEARTTNLNECYNKTIAPDGFGVIYGYFDWAEDADIFYVSGNCPNYATQCAFSSTNIPNLFISLAATFVTEGIPTSGKKENVVNIEDAYGPFSRSNNFPGGDRNPPGLTRLISGGMETVFYIKNPLSIQEGLYTFKSSYPVSVYWYGDGVLYPEASQLFYIEGQVRIAGSCDIAASETTLYPLSGDFTWQQLNSLSVNSNFGEADMSIDLTNCTSTALPQLTLVDKNNTSNTSNIISLTPEATNGKVMAQGVGIQAFVDNSSTPATLNTMIDLSASYSKGGTLPIVFKYIKTSSTVDAGQADGIIDLNFKFFK